MNKVSNIYLDKAQSESIKGLLIILIVMLHNDLLLTGLWEGRVIQYIGMFHVEGFFILPFFYNKKSELSLKNIVNTIVRCWVPYTWLFLLCFFIFSVYQRHISIDLSMLSVYFHGMQETLSNYFGFRYLWFLPTFCLFSIVFMFVRRFPILNILFITIFSIYLVYTPLIYIMHNENIPLGFGLVLTYLGAGAITFYINKYISWGKYLATVVFVAMTFCFFYYGSSDIIFKIVPIVFFLMIILIFQNFTCVFLQNIGKHSFVIYLLSPLVGNFLYVLLPKNLVFGFISFVLSIALPYFISIIVNRNDFFRKLFLPHDIDELKYMFRTKKG